VNIESGRLYVTSEQGAGFRGSQDRESEGWASSAISP
jgi:hypothetical protein